MLCVTALLVGTGKSCSYISHNVVPVFSDFNATASFRNDRVILRWFTGRVTLCFMLQEWNSIDALNVPFSRAHHLQTSRSFAVLATSKKSLHLEKGRGLVWFVLEFFL